MTSRANRLLHDVFEASLLAKGLFALTETLLGAGLYLIGSDRIRAAVEWMARRELMEDRNDWLARHAIDLAGGLSIGSEHFFALYLASHGLIKLLMVGALALRVTWAYPASIFVLLGFIAYQIHRYMAGPSAMLILLTLFDLVVIWLIWHEYRTMVGRRRP